ncbi:signal peptidase I [Aphanothece hegewaldii CCALA 016]|uniref:Signal peptidase I n=2 Tax=Aphanothece TaxID=1121 RepID=A0A2T1M074_9CHRO|nr:signal peptidase I [Aphanothece hegewaldii CCALA 016]
MFFPGLGQFYGEKIIKGLFWSICQIIAIIAAIWSCLSPDGQTSTGLIFLGITIIIYLANILDAHWTVYTAKNDKSLEKIPRTNKNPWFAVFVSRVLPGLGQLYGNHSILGLIFLTASLIFLRLDDLYPSLLIISPTLAAIATYHAYLGFPQKSSFRVREYRSIVAVMVGLIFAWGIIWNYLPNWIDGRWQLFNIPSESMQPTLQIGDFVLVKKSSSYVPQQKDVVVFKTPDAVKKLSPDAGDYFIKRIIGKPEDKIQIENGIVYINNQPLEETYISEPPDYQWGPEIVPSQAYFVLGDNRNASLDSHAWGFLSKDYLVGQAYKISWPLGRGKSLILK